MKIKFPFIARLLTAAVSTLILVAPSAAEVIPVEQIEKGFFISSDPTMTFLWPAEDAKATLIFIPGGTGSIGMKPSWPDLRYHFSRTLKRLSDPNLTSGKLNVVIFDNPRPLDEGSLYSYPSSRATSDHLIRMESTVMFYKDKLKKPVWLMGHSNGAVSVTEFYKYLQKKGRGDLIDGLIYSAGRHGARFSSDANIPVLFLHHEKDECQSTTSANSLRVFNALNETGKVKTEYRWIKTGYAESSNPCSSGYHMYFGAGEEVAQAIDEFVLKFYATPN